MLVISRALSRLTARVRQELTATAINEDGAGSALAVVATLLGAGEVELLAECIEEAGAGVQGDGTGLAVDV